MKIMYCITRSNWGDMSLVGPRPERFTLTQKFSEKWSEFPQRLRIIPGLTGYAQIHGGYDLKPYIISFDNYSTALLEVA